MPALVTRYVLCVGYEESGCILLALYHASFLMLWNIVYSLNCSSSSCYVYVFVVCAKGCQ